VIDLAIIPLGRGPHVPAVFGIEDRLVFAALKFGLVLLRGFEIVQVFQEQESAGLLGVIELGREALVVAHGPVDVIESVFEHGWWRIAVCGVRQWILRSFQGPANLANEGHIGLARQTYT